jgi:ClpP class serine protease
MEKEDNNVENLIKKQKLKIDDTGLEKGKYKKTSIKPSEKEIEEIRTLWEKFHKEIIDKVKKKSEE